jgi:hypothetical protein
VSGLTYGSYAVSVVGLLVALGALGLLAAFRARPVMLLSQPVFMLLFISGMLLMAASLFPFVVASYAPSATVCLVHKWLFNVGFVLAIASLLVKEYRSYRVFQSTKNMVRYKEDRCRLLGLTCLLEVPVVALLIVHSLVGDPGPNSDNRCGNSPYSITVFVYEAILAIALVIMAFVAREVPSVAGDSCGIATAASLICFNVFFTAAIVLSRRLDVSIETLVVTFTIMFCICITLLIIVFKRALYLQLTHQEIVDKFLEKTSQRSYAVSRASTSSMPPRQGSRGDQDDLQQQRQQRKSFLQETELPARRERQSTDASSASQGLQEDWTQSATGRTSTPDSGVGAVKPKEASAATNKAEAAPAPAGAEAGVGAGAGAAPAGAAVATALLGAAAAALTASSQDTSSSKGVAPPLPTAPLGVPELPPRPPTPTVPTPSRDGDTPAFAGAASVAAAAAAAARPSAADMAQARYMAKLNLMIDAKKALAFHAGTRDGWEHYIDRESGAEWWLNATTLEIMSEDPASDPGSRASSHRHLSVG